ncbi:MAG TPA: lytic transglycosylase domain-containing protein [Nocardioidaceae bacterium]|nr:lytic transglycosylase domain-containing protein [Nocardioidaceae bacterium]
MSQKRLTTWQKATALVPLALLSGAWTTSLAVTSSASATTQETSVLPDGTTVPDEALEAPASMSRPGSIAPGVPAGAADSVVASSSANGIPAAALAAYQRAEQVINSADTSCNLTWQLVAAIGRVESDHGRYGGNVLGDDGKSRPGIYGIALDGSNGTAEIRDTDGGRYDNDQVWDRAVGPMQFIPQTWEIVGVDGDGDGKRDPQDIDDAALATAVYLCSGDEDLSTYGGQKAAVYRYNHSREYVDLVISIMNAYLEGDFSSVPNGVATSTVFTPSPGGTTVTQAKSGNRKQTRDGAPKRDGSRSTRTGTGSGGGGGTTAPEVPQEKPGEDTSKSLTDTTKETVKKTTDTVEDTTKKVTEPLDEATGGTLTKAEATAKCLAKGLLAGTAAFDACVAELTK